METMSILAFVLALVLVAGAAFYRHFRRLQSNMASPGWMWFNRMNMHTPADLHVFVEKTGAGLVHALVVRKTDSWLTFLFGMQSYAVITHPDIAQIILKNEDVFPKDEQGFMDLGGLLKDSLINSNGEKSKMIKEVLSPAFHFEYMKKLVPVFTQKAEELFALWEASSGKDIGVKPHMGHYTSDTIGLAAFNIDFNSVRGGTHRYLDAFKRITNYFKTKKDVLEAEADLSKMSYEIIATRLAQRDGQERDILDRLLTADDKLTKEQIRANVFMMFTAGTETSSNALVWSLYFLAKYPEMQQRAREEVDAILKGNVPDVDSVKLLPYLDMFIKESLRHSPGLSNLLTRDVTEDIPVGQYLIPKGSKVGLSIYSIHRLKEFWPEPEKFDPLRFTPERSEGRHPFAYMPFSLGRRKCIGNNFSTLQQKILLSMLLQRFTIELSPKNNDTLVPSWMVCWARNIVINVTPRGVPVTRVPITEA